MRQVLFEIPGIHLKLFGFGLMLCLAFLGAISLAVWRSRRVGLNPDRIYDISFAIMLGGLMGARLFYVVQYWGKGQIRGPLDIFGSGKAESSSTAE